jgi:osmotically-inducible protein OsmY
MRTDGDLLKDVQTELQWDPTIAEREIGVMVKDGVATLTGFVDTFPQKWAAQRAAERVSGLRAMADDLTVRLASRHERDDTSIAHAVANALTWDVEVPHQNVAAKVSHGTVTLEGKVDWQYQRIAAERAIRYLTGVRSVLNRLLIVPSAVASDAVQRIRAALHRGAELEARKIHVDASEGRITLRGTVHSWAERQDIERAAWSTQGVTAVDDLITVSP